MTSALAPIMAALPEVLPRTQRFVIAIAGPPAAGKSTLAAKLAQALSPRACVLGLDAFHHANTILEPRGDLPRKGAPHTFDVTGYRELLTRLRSQPEAAVDLPVFDRRLDATRAAAAMALPAHAVVITEGNYLLLDQPPWSALAPLFDLTVWVDVPETVIEDRIMRRWAAHGLDREAAQKRFDDNDGPNARLTTSRSRPADIVVTAD